MKRTYHPSLIKMKHKHGFRARNLKVLISRKLKKRYRLSR